jgi:hypothetical protein
VATEVINIRPQGATFVRQAKPRGTFAGRARDYLRVDASDARALLSFRVNIPAGYVHVSSELQLRAEEQYGSANRTVTLRRTKSAGRPFSQINWSNQPDVVDNPTVISKTQSGDERWWTFDTSAETASDGFVIFQVRTDSASPMVFRGTRDANGYPILAVTVERLPAVPFDLAPDGVVGVAKPHLVWSARPGFTARQVQVATDETFTSILFDSGWVTGNKPEFDLSSTAWAGLVNGGAEVSWRARGQYPNGRVSGWSDDATMQRVDKVAPVILNPSGGVSADASPPILWTPPPGQTAWQVLVDLDYRGESWDRQSDSGVQPGGDGGWAPTGVGGDDPGTRYRARVRSWDGVVRSPSPGDPEYAESVVEWTWEPSGVIPGVSSTAVTQVGELPAVVVHHTRDATPDEIGLLVRTPGLTMKRVYSGLEPALVWDLPPNRDLAVEVAAVVNGEWSSQMQVVHVRTKVTGLWLVDPETGRGCVLADKNIELAYGAQVASYTPQQAAALVHRTTALRGIAGTVSGRLDVWPGRTADEQQEDLWWLRERPYRTLRLIGGDMNIPVTVTNPAPLWDVESSFHHTIRHNVSFGVSQTRDEIPRGA